MRTVVVAMLLGGGLMGCSSDAGMLLGARPAVSLARSPDAGCGSGFERKSVQTLLDEGVPLRYLLQQDANGNGFLCSRPLPDTMSPLSPEFGHLEIVDDRGPA